MKWVCSLFCSAFVAVVCSNCPVVAEDGGDPDLPMVMYHDPEVSTPPVQRVFDERLKPLWLEALARPESDLKRLAAETIARAHQRGMPDLLDTADELLKTIEEPDQHPVVKLAVARALIALDHHAGAEVLFRQAADGGLDMAQLVEPALARWDYKPIRDVWLKRLSNRRTPRRRQRLAIRGVRTVGEVQAIPHLRDLALSPEVPRDLRLEAARALGWLQTEGLEDAVRPLTERASPATLVDRLVAAACLAQHSGHEAEALLLKLAVDPEPAVGVAALKRLFEIDPELLIPIVEECLESGDSRMRHYGARALHARPTRERIIQLAPVLDDVHPEVRRDARRFLIELAEEPRFDATVREAASDVLAEDNWRGLEQAALVLGAIDHEPAAERLVALLDFPRAEVCIAAAFALADLQVPETLPAMLVKARQSTTVLKDGGQPPEAQSGKAFSYGEVDTMVCHIFQAFGLMQYEESAPLLRRYIRKDGTFCHARAAAIWALGKIYLDRPEPELMAAFSARLTDYNPLNPEDDRVRQMAAVSLGHMGSDQGLPALRTSFEQDTLYTSIGASAAWAIHRITGETFPTPEPQKKTLTGWFLEPID